MKGTGPGSDGRTEALRLPQTRGRDQTGVAWARGLVILAAILFSTGGAAIKTGAFSALQVSSARSGIAALALLIFVRGRWRVTGPILATAVAYAACLTLFVAATRLTTSASAIFLQSTAPLYLLVISPWLLREPLHRRDVGYALGMTVGLAICFLGQPAASQTAPDPSLGNLLGFAAGLAWAGVLVGLRYAARHGDEDAAISAVLLGNAIAALAVLPFAYPFPSVDALAWANLIYLGVVQIGLAYLCLTRALGHVPALEASLLLLLEPVLNPFWTWVIRGEDPGAWAMVGGACILGASAMRALRRAPAAH
jgi:drug/metabolite transporter (DMT)-like permease